MDRLARVCETLDRASTHPVWWLLVAAGDMLLSVLIIRFVSYTEIDWVAYMQEVEGPLLHDEWDYMQLKGDTGPLVYPAGFVYIFMLLRYVTDAGKNIRRAQYIFAAIHALVVYIVMGTVYYRDDITRANKKNENESKRKMVPFWVTAFIVCSRRVHSIFALRLFNDGVAMLFVYICIFLLVRRRWTLACFFFSVAFSIKMNIILFVPGLAVVLLETGGLLPTFMRGLMCLVMQAVLASPFLLTNAGGYMHRAFELGRVFMFKWTVNFKFLPEDIFVSPELALGLVIMNLVVWVCFGQKHFAASTRFGLFGLLRDCVVAPNAVVLPGDRVDRTELAHHIIWVLFTSNFIGIVFCRSIHYQFYSWYFHTLGYLVYTSVDNILIGGALILLVEVCYNVYPATPWSSLLWQATHLFLLLALWKSPVHKVIAAKKKRS
mmetsp:Transcript_18164/g.29484  ORF Transcript_18164/g.29484 Transcript_18164/m.29484 type:complete len:434 (+) Transcript_18164:173-1474(+)